MTDPSNARLAQLSGPKRQLLDRLLAEGGDAAPLIRPAGQPVPRWETTAGQRRHYLHQEGEPGAAFWNMRAALRVRGPLSSVAYERALRELLGHHDALRGSFVREGSRVYQVTRTQEALQFAIDDLRGIPTADREAAVARALAREEQRPFDLGQDLPVRGRIMRLADEEYAVLVTAHHIVLDGWSANQFLHQLDDLYAAIEAGDPLPPRRCELQFSDYAGWQNRWLRSAERLTVSHFWRQELADAPGHVDLPTSLVRPAAPRFVRGYLPLKLDGELSDAARSLAAAQRTTLYTIVVTAFGLLLGRLIGTDDVLVSVPVASRPQRELEELIGLFANLVPLRLRLPDGGTFTDAVRLTHAAVRRSFARPELPIEELIAEKPVRTPPGYAPLSQLIFAMYNYPKYTTALSQYDVETFDSEPSHALLIYAPGEIPPDMCIRLNDSVGVRELTGLVEYNSTTLDRDSVERLFEVYPRMLGALVSAPTQPLDEIAAVPARVPR
jgi:hypothetical protein